MFDLDGTLADTESIHWETYNILLSQYGVYLEDEDIRRYIGKPEQKIYTSIEKDFSIKIDTDSFYKERMELFMGLAKSKKLSPYPYFSVIKDRAFRQKGRYILTAQSPILVNFLLSLWCLDEFFPKENRIFCNTGKPTKTEVFADCSGYFNCQKENVVLFEDSIFTIQEGKKRGIFTLGVEHKYNFSRLANSDILIKTL